jgi:S-methylmethionine-dependent homocysteine/selenocysteine methylase
MNCRREALAALRAARESGLDVLLSLCPAAAFQLLSGEPLEEVLPELLDAGAPNLRGMLLNCATPETLETIYARFASLAGGLPHGLYAHLGEPDPVTGWKLPVRHEPERYSGWINRRLDEGARLVGGCCGTTPAHIAAIARRIAHRGEPGPPGGALGAASAG